MITKNSRGLLATVVTILLVVSGVTLIGAARVDKPQSPPPSPSLADSPAPRPDRPHTSTAPVIGPVLLASAPVSITIPAIDVRSPLLKLGQTPDGTMEVPPPGPHYDEAGWYRYSPTPGAMGPAIIVGHVDSATEPRSVFFRLGSLRTHDRVLVRRADDTVAIFEVDKVRTFHKTRFPTQLVYGDTDHAALRLITCGGPLDSAGHYRDNVVVLASLVGSRAALATIG